MTRTAHQPTTFAVFIEAKARILGDKSFLHFDERVTSFAELNRQVKPPANRVGALGARAGVGVAIMTPNSAERLFVSFATRKIGGWSQGNYKP